MGHPVSGVDFLEDHHNNVWLFLEALARRRTFIVLFTLITVILSTVIVVLLPDWYNSSALLLPPAEETQPVINVSGGDGAGFELSSLTTSADVLVRILNSRDISDRMVRSFSLMERLNAESMQDAEKKLQDVVDIYKTEEGLLYISVDDKDPAFAAKLANGFITELDSLTRSVASAQAREKVNFFNERLVIANEQLGKARMAFQEFQIENRALDFEEQTHLAIEQAIQLRIELAEIDINIQLAELNLSGETGNLSEMRGRKKAIQEKLKTIEYGGSEKSYLTLPLSSIPVLRGKYDELYGMVKVSEALTSMLIQQVEQAKIQEGGLVEYSVLAYARESEIPVRPNRLMLLIVACFGSLGMAIFLALLLEYFKVLAEKSPHDYDRAVLFYNAYLGWMPGMGKKSRRK
ncbi:MAG: Wzz/FepE/Etk N-terminal domain-containing protein [bacterium]|nr:Wzz/FepE/Etk N-terminal domain-containing protein [bacterium]